MDPISSQNLTQYFITLFLLRVGHRFVFTRAISRFSSLCEQAPDVTVGNADGLTTPFRECGLTRNGHTPTGVSKTVASFAKERNDTSQFFAERSKFAFDMTNQLHVSHVLCTLFSFAFAQAHCS